MARVLVVEPEPLYRKLFPIWIRNHVGAESVEVHSVAGAAEAERAAGDFPPDVLLTVHELAGNTDGLKLARRVRAVSRGVRVILISQTPYLALQKRLSRSPRTQFLVKPVGEVNFTTALDAALAEGAQRSERRTS